MIFVDTNYFLRFLIKDNDKHYKEAEKIFINASEGKVELISSTVVFFEINWVLNSYYGRKTNDLVGFLWDFLNLNFIILEERQLLAESVELFTKTNLSLIDCYHIVYAKSKGVKSIKTFDKKLEKEFKK